MRHPAARTGGGPESGKVAPNLESFPGKTVGGRPISAVWNCQNRGRHGEIKDVLFGSSLVGQVFQPARRPVSSLTSLLSVSPFGSSGRDRQAVVAGSDANLPGAATGDPGWSNPEDRQIGKSIPLRVAGIR